MFGGSERRRSSNVRYKQMFHELKQLYPTIPDDVIAKCILEQANNNSLKKNSKIIEVIQANLSSGSSSVEPMGRSSSQCEVPTLEQVDKPESVACSTETTESTSPRKKTYKNHKKAIKVTRTETREISSDKSNESSPEPEETERRRERRNKLSSLLKKTTRVTKGVLKQEDRSHSRKYSIRPHHRQKRDTEDSSSRETTPLSDQEEEEEEEVFPTVSALRQQFESTSHEALNDIVLHRAKSKSRTPPRGSEMNQNVPPPSPDVNQNVQDKFIPKASPKRPTTLALIAAKPDSREWRNSIQPSEKCKNLPKLLNSNILSDKPPRSPVHNKKIVNTRTKNVSSSPQEVKTASASCSEKEEHLSDSKDCTSPNTGARKKETVSTPTQTTDTLLGDSTSGSVNLSFNVNCSMDLIRSPITSRRTSALQVTPETPWLQEPTSPRSYTSVNLTLRPPSSTPQPPIDITSQNASLTYSTSSFDSQKGLQSRLQITVGPTGGNVTASRVRQKSCELDVTDATCDKFDVPVIGSPSDMVGNKEPPVIIKQQARIERLRIELTNEKTKLIVLKKEVADIENKTSQRLVEAQRQEVKLKIAHLRYQCRKLVQDLNDFAEPEFYNNLYRGQPLDVNGNSIHPRVTMQRPTSRQDPDGPKWDCHVCTFLNHPELNKCEQCDMPRFIHGRIFPPLANVNLPNANLRLQN